MWFLPFDDMLWSQLQRYSKNPIKPFKRVFLSPIIIGAILESDMDEIHVYQQKHCKPSPAGDSRQIASEKLHTGMPQSQAAPNNWLVHALRSYI